MRGREAVAPQVSEAFGQASNAQASSSVRQKPKPAPPFSLRLSAEERARLEEQAGSRPLGSYIRHRLLGENTDKRRTIRKPKIDEQKLVLVLAQLGKSRLSSNLNQLAKAANMGTLDVSQEVGDQLQEACRTVLAMRDALITALGLKAEGGP